jgi:hypothetical protein
LFFHLVSASFAIILFFSSEVFEKNALKCYIDALDAVDVAKRPRLSVIPASK